jgi:predicted DNA-binding transcriptional regulator
MGILRVWGIDDVSEAVYRVMLRRPELSIEQVATEVGVDDDLARDALTALCRRGLVREHPTPSALPPTPTITGLLRAELTDIEARRSELESVRAQLSMFTADHLVGQTGGWSKMPFELLAEPEALAAMDDLQRSTTGEVLACHRVTSGPQPPEEFFGLVRDQLAAGRPMRGVYPASVVDDSEKLDYVLHWAAHGEDVRLGPVDIPEIDVLGHVALVSGEWEGVGDTSMIVVHAPAMVAIVRELFERIWERSVPLRRVTSLGGDQRENGQRDILELLMLGAKDEAIARHLGVSLRTVRRRVADLMDDLGAGTRFQAGMEAVRRGWL